MRFLKENIITFEEIKEDTLKNILWFLENGYDLHLSISRAIDFIIHNKDKYSIVAQHYTNNNTNVSAEDLYNKFFEDIYNIICDDGRFENVDFES